MFGRWRKGKEESGLTCPLCGEVSPEETVECPKCYHQLGKSSLEQKLSVSEEDSTSLFDELLSEDEDDDEGEIVDWSRHSFEIDDVAIDVSQYEEDSDSVTLSHSPNFAAIEADVPKPVRQVTEELEEGAYELSSKDAPKNVEKFVVPTSNDELTPMVEPEHRVDLVVPLLPSGAKDSSSDDEEGPLSDPSAVDDEDELTVEKSSAKEETASSEPTQSTPVVKPIIPKLSSESTSSSSVNGATIPKLPATPDNISSTKKPVPIPNIPSTSSKDLESQATKPVTTPVLPTPPDSRPGSEAFKQEIDLDVDANKMKSSGAPTVPNRDGEMWPWPQQEAHDDLTVKRELRQIMESVKAGNLDEASRNLDKLGPHLGDRNEILFHVGVVLKKLGREDALRRMLESARRLHPEDQHVATALTSLGM